MAPMRGGYREAGCATCSLVDGDGERLHSVRMGRMPESHKATLKTMVAAEVEAVLGQRPDLTVVKLADGAKDNWTFLTRALPAGVELIGLLPRRRASQRRLRHRPRWPTVPKAAARQEVSRHLLRHEPVSSTGSTERHSGVVSICARSLRATSESHRFWATSMAIATACATPMPRPGDCPSAPASWRRRARPWSPNGSNAPACDGGRVADPPF